MSDILVKLYNLFNSAAQSLIKYIPQSKEDILALWGQILDLLLKLNGWVAGTLGIDIQKVVNTFIIFFVKYFVIVSNFIIEAIKKLLGQA